MRTWYVPLEILDPQRVLAQHREVHTVIGSLLSSRRGYQHHPVVKLYAGEHMACLLSYHAETVKEFERRGWHGHRTTLDPRIVELAMVKSSDDTCENWAQHVSLRVSHDAPHPEQGWHHDMHDLVKRWVREEKFLRHLDSWDWVKWHVEACESARCQSDGRFLLSNGMSRRETVR